MNNPCYKFSLGEIIDNKTLFKLKNEIVTRQRVKERLNVVNEKNYRTNYAYISKIKESNEILNYKKIRGDKLELINYIHSHNQLSD